MEWRMLHKYIFIGSPYTDSTKYFNNDSFWRLCWRNVRNGCTVTGRSVLCSPPPFILSVLKLLQPSNSTFSSYALCTGHRYHCFVPSQSAYLRSRCIEMCHPALKFMALSETTCISLCRCRRDKRVGAQCVPDRRPK